MGKVGKSGELRSPRFFLLRGGGLYGMGVYVCIVHTLKG